MIYFAVSDHFDSFTLASIMYALEYCFWIVVGNNRICIRMLEVVQQTSSASKWGNGGVSETRFGRQNFYQVANSLC
jgi:hypothetical protein